MWCGFSLLTPLAPCSQIEEAAAEAAAEVAAEAVNARTPAEDAAFAMETIRAAVARTGAAIDETAIEVSLPHAHWASYSQGPMI